MRGEWSATAGRQERAGGKGRFRLGRTAVSLDALWQGGWMLLAALLTGILNYLSNIVVGRLLGPAEYGAFAALLSLLLILSVPTSTVQTVTTTWVARLKARAAAAEAGAVLRVLLKRLLPWGIGSALALGLASGPLAAFLQIPSRWPVVVLGLVLIPSALLPVVSGGLGGLQRFGALGATQIGGAALRLGGAVALVAAGWGVNGAVGSLSLASLGSVLLGGYLQRDMLRRRPAVPSPAWRGAGRYAVRVALAAVGFALLTNADMIAVKSRFPPAEAGLFAAAATLGKALLWFSGALMALLLPKVAEREARGEPALGLLAGVLLAIGLLCGGGTLVFSLAPSAILSIFFGTEYRAGAALLGPYGLAMTGYSLANAWLVYSLAAQRSNYPYLLLAAAGLQAVLFWVLPLTPGGVIRLMIYAGAGLFLLGLWCLGPGRREAQREPG